MRLEKITVAQNGFIVEDCYGHLHIAKTLLEAAHIVGETIPNPLSTTYDVGMSLENLQRVRAEVLSGNKINAIKELRNCFVPRIGLREAKDMVDNLCK